MADGLLLEQGHRQALASGEVGRGGADEPTADDDDPLGHRDPSSAEPIGARAVRSAVMTSACSALWLPCCW